MKTACFVFLAILFSLPASPLRAEEENIKIALVGDSTVTDSAGWGKAFANRFSANVRVRNFAAGGRSSKSWLAEGRLGEVVAVHNRLGAEASADFSPKEGDITHLNEVGAEAIADLIVEEVRRVVPSLRNYLK